MLRMLKFILLALFILLVSSTIVNEWKADLTIQEMITGPVFWRISLMMALLASIFFGWGFLRKIEASQKYKRAEQVLEEAKQKAERKKESVRQLQVKIEAECEEKLRNAEQELEKEKQKYKENLNKLERRNLELQESISRLMKLVKKRNNGEAG